MCGIAGISSFSSGLKNSELNNFIKKQIRSLTHRGPDAEGYFIEDRIALGHRRLSIIDPSEESNQPMQDISGRYIIVFNGEIYNYQEVKRQINEYPWQTNSDTEVILAAYIKWGNECLRKLNGMFSFAIWDKTKQELFIARDRLGVKPFYYHQKNQTFIFASEIRSILATGLINKDLNPKAVIDFLGYQAVKTPDTIAKDILQLPPGTFGVFNTEGFAIHTYWSMMEASQKPFSFNYQDTLDQVKNHFMEAVKSRMVADVPISAFLSGGIDSSAIVAIMTQLSPKPIETYSIVFKEKAFDESEYARIIAKKYGTQHTELLLNPSQLLNELPSFFSSMDSPTIDGINTYIVSKMVAQTGTRVTLSGLGGDELFAGYEGFRRYRQFNRYNSPFLKVFAPLLRHILPSTRAGNKLTQLADNPSWTLSSFYTNSRAIFLPNEIKALGLTSYDKNAWFNLNDPRVTNYPILSQYSIAELTNYTLDVLMKDTDQMSMASSLEVREPFFDYRLIEFILKVPDTFKYQSKIPKSLLVNALGNLLPPEIIHRPKKGFSFPWEQWIKTDLKDFCQTRLDSLSTRGLFEKKTIYQLWNNFLNHKHGIIWLHIWALVTLDAYLTENNL